MILRKIISGGQTGADQGGLVAAAVLGLETGGWMPRGFQTELGPMPDIAKRYKLLEHTQTGYLGRTLTNAVSSDGTLWFGLPNSPGGFATMRRVRNARKPVYVYVWPKNPANVLDQFFLDWLAHEKITVLNVAGNRESRNAGIFVAVRQYLVLNITALAQGTTP